MSSSRNTGRRSEDIFDDHFQRLGKRAYVHVFTDAAEVNGMNKGKGLGRVGVKAQPADRLVVLDGVMFLAEVKSSISRDDRFDFKLLKPGQKAAGAQTIAAGGQYWVYYHHLATDEWFRFSFSMVQTHQKAGLSSIPLALLRDQNLYWHP